MYKKIVFDNGLRIILAPRKDVQTVTVMALVGTGSEFDGKKKGLAHFFEHMVFKGTKKYSNHKKICEAIEGIGGELNAGTGQEDTMFYAKIPCEYLDRGLSVISELIKNPKIPSKEIEKERLVIIEEAKEDYDLPPMLAAQLLDKLMFGKQPAGWPIEGSIETIRKIDREDLVRYMNSHIVSNSVVIVVAGNFNSRRAESKIKRCFFDLRQGKLLEKKQTRENQSNPRLLIRYKNTKQTNLVLGIRAPSVSSPLAEALRILTIILGGNMSSRLFLSLREERGLV